MRYKVVPSPAEWELLVATRDALPLVPGTVEDCCARIRDRTSVASRDDAREWLTFLTALGLADETSRGYHRERGSPDREGVAPQFRQSILGAAELLEGLQTADGGLDTGAAFDAVRPAVPNWERDRYPDWEDVWRERVRLLLEWSVVFDIVERRGDVYRLAD